MNNLERRTEMTQDTKEKLQELVSHYYLNKNEADSYKKIAEKDNAAIKEIMLQEHLPEITTADGIKATCSISEKESFVEDALIEKIKSLGVKGIVKKKEYVDMEALENAIYNGKLNAAELASCQEKKQIVTLRVGRAKN